MTFTAVSAGELIKASIANANWRHVGRLGADLIPMNTSGVGVDDTYSIGSLLYQYNNLYLSATGKIYIGGVELSLGGGGGGGGLESIALANAFDKQGMAYPLPSNKFLRNAFTSDTEMLIYLRKNYATADTTTMVADHGLNGELETINDMQTVGDFTAGTSTPTVAANTSEFLENTQSIKFTATTLNGSADMYDAVTLSLTDRNFRVSVYPDTLTNVSYVYVILYTSSGNQRKFDFAVANLTAKAWNHLTCDLNLASGTTSGGVTVTDTGTFVRSTITRIYYGITTTSAQTVVPSFDLARAISDKPLMIPDYGLTLTIQDNTNQDTFTITDEDDTDYTTKGTYTIAAALGNNYTNIDSTDYASSTTGTIENNQLIHKSTASGQNAKTAKQHDVLALSSTMAAATLESFLRFYDESFKVTDFPTTGSIKVYADSDKSGYFLDNDYILLYKKLQHGRNNQSPEGSHTVNFLRLQLNANASYSSNEITLSHDGSNSVGADTTGYYVILESAYLEYSAGAKTASTFTQAVPSELIVNNVNNKFSDNFNRANGAAANGWLLGIISSNLTTGYQGAIYNNVLQWGLTGGSVSKTFVYRKDGEGYGINALPITITGEIGNGWGTNLTNADAYILVGSNLSKGSDIVNDGCGAYFRLYYSSTEQNKIAILKQGAIQTSANYGPWDNNKGSTTSDKFKIYITKDSIKLKVWPKTTTEPGAWSLESDISFANNGLYLVIGAHLQTGGTSDQWAQFDNLEITYNQQGHTLKYKIPNLTNVDKLETVHTLIRNDTTNQNPILYETGSLLY